MRHTEIIDASVSEIISIHAPRVRCDAYIVMGVLNHLSFQSTHLVWGATFYSALPTWKHSISIHAPRVRCDSSDLVMISPFFYFNPRTSCEVRHISSFSNRKELIISIHAPRVRCDFVSWLVLYLVSYFNPRTSCEVRHKLFIPLRIAYISIHAPRVRCDIEQCWHSECGSAFQSTHLVWGATLCWLIIWSIFFYFNPRTSCEVRRLR